MKNLTLSCIFYKYIFAYSHQRICGHYAIFRVSKTNHPQLVDNMMHNELILKLDTESIFQNYK